ncbi:uncharacterized protein LOC128958166 [Oppia nitens]|uniref:uncharacterized protein LOC128958166 n=1 Tax=Oppia nitens TaxID=1686743 RepID=UPI0023DA4158|nr:uncharacterized protein LOC128958166 [Oppia nitens]
MMDVMNYMSSYWTTMQSTWTLSPYVFKELDRKYNKNTKIRLLKETDSDLEADLTGKVCVITGGSRGLGVEVVKTLLRKGCHVITGSSKTSESERNKRYEQIMSEVNTDSRGRLDIWHLDLKSMDSVVKFAKQFEESKLSLNYFIANAGVVNTTMKLTDDGFEDHIAVNYLSHCLLIDHFIDNMYRTAKQSGSESRIVMVSSGAHRAVSNLNVIETNNTKNMPIIAYSISKLYQIMFTNRMTKWLANKGDDWRSRITFNSLHPGMCDTQLLDHFPMIEVLRPMAAQACRTPKEGAETTIYAILSKEMMGISGKYLEDSAQEQPSVDAINISLQNKLW